MITSTRFWEKFNRENVISAQPAWVGKYEIFVSLPAFIIFMIGFFAKDPEGFFLSWQMLAFGIAMIAPAMSIFYFLSAYRRGNFDG